MHVYRVRKKKFEILKKSFKTHGISARVHSNKGSKPPNALYSFAVMRSDTQRFSAYCLSRTKFGIVLRLYSNHWVGISAGE